jgi:hypothetical protein
MSYEKTVIPQATQPQTAQPIEMRQEKVFTPYSSNDRLEKAMAAVEAKNGQTNITEETVSGEAPATKEETVTLSPQMAALARKEQKFRQQQLELKKQKAELEARAAKLKSLEEIDQKLANKDYSAIEDKVNYDEYTKYLIEKNANLSPEQQELKRLAAETQALKKQREEDLERNFEAAVKSRKQSIDQLIDSSTEFSKIKKLGEKGKETVLKHILDTFEEDGVELTVEQAAKEVQNIFLEQAKSWADLLSEETTEEQPTAKQLQTIKQGMKTLTNNMAPVGESKTPRKPYSQMSDGERYAEARRRAEEKLKQGRI